MSQAGFIENYSAHGRNAYPIDAKLGLYTQACPARQQVEHYIAQKYLQVHAAHVREYLPVLVGIHAGNALLGAFGLRPGQYRPMFLEQYLDSPIEQQVASITRQPVNRCVLVEIGNLAITQNGYGRLLMVMLAMSLAEAGYEWMVFTVTERVERLMKRLGFEPHYLSGADPDRLRGDKSLWGSYYENNPRVMVGELKVALEIISGNPQFHELAKQQRENISIIADAMRNYRLLSEVQ